RRDLRDEIVRLQKRLGITVVFVTHSQQEALAISDRVAVLKGGQVIQYDTVETLYRHPRDRFVASFVGEANFLETEAGTRMLRPEQMDIVERPGDDAPREPLQSAADPARGASPEASTVPAVIETHQFLGAHHRYECRSELGPLIVTSPHRYRVGTEVTVAYYPTEGCIV
ncbi:MAG TPA: TOBE domain-containing protein, partial [Alkalispirochaeta sp.]|nr:TOBE domain-containing protein [Alkalispirochaeta sp.]